MTFFSFLLSLCLSPCISRPESIFPWNSTSSTSNPTNSSNPSSPLHSSHLLDTMACPRLAMPCFASSASNCCMPSSHRHCHSRNCFLWSSRIVPHSANSTASSPWRVLAMNRFPIHVPCHSARLQCISSPANPNPTSAPSTSSNCPSHRPLPYQAPISLVREMLEPVSAVVMALFVPHWMLVSAWHWVILWSPLAPTQW